MFRTTIISTLLISLVNGQESLHEVLGKVIDQLDRRMLDWQDDVVQWGKSLLLLVLSLRELEGLSKDPAAKALNMQEVHMSLLRHADGWRLIFRPVPPSIQCPKEYESIFCTLRTIIAFLGGDTWIYEEGGAVSTEMWDGLLKGKTPEAVMVPAGYKVQPSCDIVLATITPGVTSVCKGWGPFSIPPEIEVKITTHPLDPSYFQEPVQEQDSAGNLVPAETTDNNTTGTSQ